MLASLITRSRSISVKPKKGFSHIIHLSLTALLPIICYILVRIDFVSLAIALIFLSKWRIFAVRPRYWLANIVSSGVDLIVSLALVIFMANSSEQWWQLLWMVLFIAWLTYLKPRSDILSVSAQAMIGQLFGLAVLFLKFGDSPLLIIVGGTWLVAYLSARHFLASFEESLSALLAHSWGYFAAGLAFVLGHWLLFYGYVAQIIIILTTIGYGLAALYFLHDSQRLTTKIKRQLLVLMFSILIIVIIFSDWSGSVI